MTPFYYYILSTHNATFGLIKNGLCCDISQSIEKIDNEFEKSKCVKIILDFVNKSNRGLI